MYEVYKHTTPSGKVYIGITSRQHNTRWKKGKGYMTQLFGRAVRKYGWENIKHEVLKQGLSKEEAKYWERRYIAKYKSNNPKYGYNQTPGGDLRNPLSEEAKMRISFSNYGRKHGRPSKATRRKISKALIGNQNGKAGRKVRCIMTGQVFNTLKEAGEYFGVSSQNIGKACKGLLKHSGGMEWEYLEKENGT